MTTYTPSTRLAARLTRLIGNTLALGRRGRLCILNYHRILEVADPLLGSEPDVATFRWQMKLLADCFNVLPLDEALAAIDAGKLPPRAVAITFDDGYRSTYELALPVLREFNLPATVFVTTGFVGEGSMWNDRILESVRMVDAACLDLSGNGMDVYSTQSLDDRRMTLHTLTEKAKYLPPQQRAALIDHLDQMVGIYEPDQMLTEDMIRALAEARVEIGAHTVSHPILTSLTDSAAFHEILDSKVQLERITGKPVRYFAYPNGKQGMDFDERHVRMTKRAGFEAAFTTAPSPATATDDRYTIPRGRPWDDSPTFFGLRLLRWLARG